MAALNTHEQSVLATADRQLIVAALGRVIGANGSAWLSPGHRTESGIDREHRPGGRNPLTPQELAEYMALAAPNHCVDGWSYLSRGLNAYLLGDPHSAWHFAYYAELRAAQSILSASGCGVFNEWNAVIDASGSIQRVDVIQGSQRRTLATHSMVWLALRDIMRFSQGGLTALTGSAEVFGHALADLVTYAFPGQTSLQTAARWISDWTFDIGTGLEDKQFRNRCSYGPHYLTPHSAQIDHVVEFLDEFWKSSQPSPGACFLDLDKYLLRRAMHDQAVAKIQLLQANSLQPTPIQISAELAAAYDRMCSAAPVLANIPKTFFVQLSPKDPSLFGAAKNKNPAPQDPQPVLARATLLLRMATGVTRKLLLDAGYRSGTELDFWFSKLAVEQGIVESHQDVEHDRSSLYADCAVAMDDMYAAFCDAAPPVGRTKLFNDFRVKPHAVCEVNRIPHWSLQP